MSRARDRQEKREREAWAQRRAERYTQARKRAMFPLVACEDCRGSGREPDHVERDAFGAIGGALGMYQMCRKCGGDGKVRAGMLHFNVTIQGAE